MKTLIRSSSSVLVAIFLSMVLISCSASNTDIAKESQSSTEVNFPKLGVQLWSVKETLKEDYTGTLSALADMGFEGVEFAGEFGPFADDPQGLKGLLDKLGLKASAAHTNFTDLNDENFVKTVAFYQTLGVKTLILGWDDRGWDPDLVEQMISDLNIQYKKLAKNNIRFGYHNHDQEFDQYMDATFWDRIATNTPDDFILQLDVAWVVYAGHNPIDYIQRYPGRTLTTHIKAKYPKNMQSTEPLIPIIGEDITDWVEVINTDIEVGGTEWLILEQEEYPLGMTPLESVALSKLGLDKIIASIKVSKQ